MGLKITGKDSDVSPPPPPPKKKKKKKHEHKNQQIDKMARLRDAVRQTVTLKSLQ